MEEQKKTKEKTVKKELIYEKIPAIMADVQTIGKDRKNVQQKYSFRGIDDVYNEVHKVFAKHKVFTVPEVLDAKHEERTSRAGGVLIYRIYTIRYRFYASDGSYVDSVVIGEGMDSGDKAGNKAMSVAHKYALLQMLLVPTDDAKDPENESHEINGKPKPIKPQVSHRADPLDEAVYDGYDDEAQKDSFRTITITLSDGKKKRVSKFEALDYFSKIKQALGDEAYYEILGNAGYEKSNQVPAKEIPKIYAQMIEAYRGT